MRAESNTVVKRPGKGIQCIFMTARRFLISLVALFASVAMYAQNYNVTVKLEDASNGEPVGFATVSLTPEKEAPSTR